MISQERSTQLKVGFFVAIGLAVIAAMVVYFGRFGDSIRGYYQIRVEYPNASGIFKGYSVLLAGAKIGMVETSPEILPDMNGVFMYLKIYDNVKIPSKSTFSIGSSGLLGDRFIQIDLDKDSKGSPPIQPGAVIQGKGEAGGLTEIAEKAPAILAEIKQAVANINTITERLKDGVFQEKSMGDLNSTIANLKETSASFAETSKKLDGIVLKAGSAIDTGEKTMVSAKEAADELKKTIVEVRGIIQQTKQGRGALGALLVDKEMADNLKALVANMRRNGILFYKDRAQDAGGR